MNENAICKQYSAYVHKLASRYSRCNAGLFDDLVQSGFLGLIIAARKWREDGGASFITYATPWIQEYMARCLDELDGAVRLPKEDRKDRALAKSIVDVDCRKEGRGVFPEALSVGPTQEASLATKERAAIVRKVVALLPEEYRDMVESVVVEGRTCEATAAKHGCCRQYVSQIVQKTSKTIARGLREQLTHADL